MSIVPRLARGGLTVVALAGVAVAVAPRVPSSHVSGASTDPFAAALVDVSEVALFGVSTWLAVATALSTIAVVRGPRSVAARIAARLTPRFWARALGLAIGGALGGAVCFGQVTAQAAYDDSTSPGIVGLRLPDRPGGAAPPAPNDRARPRIVRRGDTLWDIAASGLPPGSTVTDRARECRRWYAANRAAIGDDPDLLLPGTQLHPPTEPEGTP